MSNPLQIGVGLLLELSTRDDWLIWTRISDQSTGAYHGNA